MPDLGRIMVMLILVIVFVVVITAKQSRRNASLTMRKQCRQCGARFGSEAQFCGRCGRAL